MTRNSIRLARLLAIGSLLFIILALAAPVQAGEPTPPKPVTIEFVDEDKLTVHQEWLKDHQEELPVKIVNKSPVKQSVTLTVEGFVPKSKEVEAALGGLLPAQETHDLEPGEIYTFALHFEGIATAELEEKAYTGVLVAISKPGGDVIRREFELQAEPKAAAPSTVEEEPSLLSKLWNPPRIEVSDKLTELTRTGVSFLPSLLNPLPAALFVIGVALLVFRWGGAKLELPLSDRVKKVSLRAGVICTLLAVLMFALSWAGVGGPWGPSLVYVEPLSVPSGADLGPIKGSGTSLGVLERSEKDGQDSLVRVRQIPGAGAYEATIDLTPGEEKGELTVKVNVTDWWPYALLTITLGVLVGYKVTRYYSQKRGVSEQTVRAAELWREIAKTEAEFQAKNAGHPQAAYTMTNMAIQWIDRAKQDLNDPGKIDAVKADLGKMEDYHDAFRRLQSSLERLEQLYHQVRERIDLKQFAVSPAVVEVYKHTENILAGKSKTGKLYAPFIDPPEDKDGTQRQECEGEVAEYAQWLYTLEQKYQQMVKRWSYAQMVSEGWPTDPPKKDPADTTKLNDQMIALETAIKNALRAGSQKEVEDAETASQGAKDAIENLAKKYGMSVSYVAKPSPRLPVFAHGLAAAKAVRAGATASEIRYTPLEVGSYGKGYNGDPDTLFVLSATVTFPQHGTYLLQWDFGDQGVSEPWVEEVKPQASLSVPLKTSHCYKKGGDYTVSLKVDGSTVTTTRDKIRIAPKGLWKRLLESFQLTDKQMTYVTGLLAVASGFTVKYLANSTWGTPKDYLEAFLWGAIGSEGLKYVAQLVKKTWDPQ